MDWYAILKIGILIFGLFSWLIFKSERSVNKDMLEEHLSERETIRDLTDEELELLEPFLTSKLAVYPYKFQSSLVDNKVSYLRGACNRESLYSNTDEIAYYYEVNNIELFFPYNMDKHIDEFNIIEVVFTKQYGIVVNINGQDIKTALENYDPNEEYELRDLKNSNNSDNKIHEDKLSKEKYRSNYSDNIDSFDIESLSLNDDSNNVDKHHHTNQKNNLKNNEDVDVNPEVSINACKPLYEREETPFEVAMRNKHNNGLLTSLSLILATVFMIRAWFGENAQISILISICLATAAFFVWYKPKHYSNPQKVNVIKAKIYDKQTTSNKVSVGGFMILEYPKYWFTFIPENSKTETEMVIDDNGKKLLSYGHTLSVNNEVEQFGPPKSVKRNKILFIVGMILSATLYYFTDPINNGYFAYRYYSQQSENQKFNDLIALKNSDIKQGDIVNISIKNTSCDVNDLNNDYKCHHFFINNQPMALKEDSVMSIDSSLKHIFDPKFVNVVVDSEMMRLENMQQQFVDMLNQTAIKNGKYYVKKSFSKLKDIGQMVIDIEKVCKIIPVERCENIKSHIVQLFDSNRVGITWNDLLTRSEKNPNINEIFESRNVHYLENALELFKSELQKELKKVVSQYQSENVIEITLTNQSYIDMAQLIMSNSTKFNEYRAENYYFDILNNNISPNINIVGLVSDVSYHEDKNSNTKSISALKVNANHHYNLEANQRLSYVSLIIFNMIMFIVMTLTATINGIKLLRNIKINRHRIVEIKKYYEERLGTYR